MEALQHTRSCLETIKDGTLGAKQTIHIVRGQDLMWTAFFTEDCWPEHLGVFCNLGII